MLFTVGGPYDDSSLKSKFVAEGRIGNAAGFGGDTCELDLGADSSSPAVTANFRWESGNAEDFSLSYDPATNTIQFNVGSESLEYEPDDLGLINALYIRVRAVDQRWNATASQLMIAVGDDAAVGIPEANFAQDTPAAVEAVDERAQATGINYLRVIQTDRLEDGFTLTGQITLEWPEGEPLPHQSQLACQIKVGRVVCGFDTVSALADAIDCISDQRFNFVAKYYASRTSMPDKVLTRAEAVLLSNNDIDIIAVFQNRQNQIGDFTYEDGLANGESAYRYARDTIQQPANSAIYFAVDFDASEAQIEGGIDDYFRGVRDGFVAVDPDPIYQIGVYGSGLTCRLLTDAERVNFTWLSLSIGWRESRTYDDWNIKQTYPNSHEICDDELIVDFNITSSPNYGQFSVE